MQLGPNFKLGSLILVAVFIFSAVGLYGAAFLVDQDKPAAAEEATGGDVVPGGPITVKLVAKNSLFDKKTITVGAGAPVTVDLDNQDAGVLHNIAFYTNRGAATKIAASAPAAGPLVEELKFTAPVAGNYFFRCDVHPDTMTGTFSVR